MADNSFPQNITIEEMELAWEHVRRSRRSEVKDRLALNIYGYPSHTRKYLSLLMEKLQQGTYEPRCASHFYKPKTDRSPRCYAFLDMDDRLVYQVLCNRLISSTFDKFIVLNRQQRVYGNIPIDPADKNDYVFRPPFDISRSSEVVVNGQFDLFRHRVLNSYDEFATPNKRSWFVRTDIRSYYPSVDHKTLDKFVKEHGWLSDKFSRELLMKSLAKWAKGTGKGIPVGYECSDYIGNLYVRDLDDALRDFRAHRYVDDLYIFVDDFEQVKDVLYRIDKTLQSLGLQRNTSKTMQYRLEDFDRDQFQTMLSTNLSVFAEERPDDVAEAKRQDELLQILEDSFDPHTDDVRFSAKISDIRRVAFVLYRLKREREDIKELAYEILDFDLKYAYHAISYLYLNHCDTRLENKLKSVLSAEYEPRALKALALAFLSKVNPPLVQDHLRIVLECSDKDDWHLIRILMQEAIEPEISSYPSDLLTPLLDWDNSFVQVYAYWLVFLALNENDQQRQLVNEMFAKDNHLVKKLGVYVAHREGLLESVDASLLEPSLQKLFPDTILNDLERFRKEFADVFGIRLSQDFPLGDFFGSISETAPIMRVIYATKYQGAADFVIGLCSFLEILLENIAKGESSGAKPSNIDKALEIIGDSRLNLLVKTLRDERAKKHTKEGIQGDLISRFRISIQSWINDRQYSNEEESEVRNQVFIGYASVDKKWLDLLVEHLQPIKDYHELDFWSDHDIESGDNWRIEINNALKRARVAVLLVTRSFLKSRFIHFVELPEILSAADNKQLRAIWIPVKPSNVTFTPIIKLEAAWKDINNTLVDMNEGNRDRYIVSATQEIAKYMGIDLEQ